MASPLILGISYLGDTALGGASEPFTQAATDTLGLTDSAALDDPTMGRALTDTLGLTDAAVAVRGAFEFLNDALGLTDSVDRTALLHPNATDTCTLTETVARTPWTVGALILGRNPLGFARLGGAPNPTVTTDTLGFTDNAIATTIQQVRPVENDQLYLADNAQTGRQAVSDLLHFADTDPDYGGVHSVKPRAVTDTLALTDALTVAQRTHRNVTDRLTLGRDLAGFATGPRYRLNDARFLSQVWGENTQGASHPNGVSAAAVDMYPKTKVGASPAFVNDTVGTKGFTSSSLLMSGGDLGFFCRLSDGRTLIAAGDNFGPQSPTGWVKAHPSVGAAGQGFGQWQYYRPSALAITHTAETDLDTTGIVIDGWHRQFRVANPSTSAATVLSVAPLQAENSYAGSPPNRFATFPQRYYAYGDGITIPNVSGNVGGSRTDLGEVALYPAITSPKIGFGLYSAAVSDLSTWTHTALWDTTAAVQFADAGGSLNVADANGVACPDYATLRADILAGNGTYYVYFLGDCATKPGLYLARSRLNVPGTGPLVSRLTNVVNWEYRTASGWSSNVGDLVPFLTGTKFLNLLSAGFSCRYHPTFGKWLLLYVGGTGTTSLGGGTRFTYRTADTLWGPWSDERWVSGYDGSLATGTNVDSTLYPYQPCLWPDQTSPDTVRFSASFGGDFDTPDPTVHTYTDDGTGHCLKWRHHVTERFATTSADIGCGLTLADHNALQAAIAAGTEVAGLGYSTPYAVFLGAAALTQSLAAAENTVETFGLTESVSVENKLATRPVTDQLHLTEPLTFAAVGENVRETTDTLPLADTLTSSVQLERDQTDTCTLTDASTVGGAPVTLDLLPCTDDAEFLTASLNVAATDQLLIYVDDAEQTTTLERDTTDSLPLSDANPTALLAAILAATDQLLVTDLAARAVTQTRPTTDRLTLTETLIIYAVLHRLATDQLPLADSALERVLRPTSATDHLPLTDTPHLTASLIHRKYVRSDIDLDAPHGRVALAARGATITLARTRTIRTIRSTRGRVTLDNTT